MTNLYAFYIIPSYLVAIVTLGALVAWLIADGRATAAKIAALEARGVRRRSADDA